MAGQCQQLGVKLVVSKDWGMVKPSLLTAAMYLSFFKRMCTSTKNYLVYMSRGNGCSLVRFQTPQQTCDDLDLIFNKFQEFIIIQVSVSGACVLVIYKHKTLSMVSSINAEKLGCKSLHALIAGFSSSFFILDNKNSKGCI